MYRLIDTKLQSLFQIEKCDLSLLALFLILSSLLTLSGSLSLTENLKDNENIATYMSTINSLNILCSFLVESCIKYKWIGFKKCIGIGFVCCGIKLLN